MKCQILFCGKNKKNISICGLLKILLRMLSINSIGKCFGRSCSKYMRQVLSKKYSSKDVFFSLD